MIEHGLKLDFDIFKAILNLIFDVTNEINFVDFYNTAFASHLTKLSFKKGWTIE